MKYLTTLSLFILMTISANCQDNPVFSFGVIADVQYCDAEPSGNLYYRNSLTKLTEAMNFFSMNKIDFLISLGDLIDHNMESYNPPMTIIENSGIQSFYCLGNHDFSVDKKQKRKLPLDLPKNGYYSFQHQGFRFIVLNGCEISTFSSSSKKTISQATNYINEINSRGGINGYEWNGAISVKQLEWFMKELDSSVAANEQVIIFCHYPVYPENKHNLLNSNEVLSAMQGYDNIVAWICGHNHAGNYGNINGTHFLTIKGMVETDSENAFTKIDVYKNKIWLNGNGREKSLILAY